MGEVGPCERCCSKHLERCPVRVNNQGLRIFNEFAGVGLKPLQFLSQFSMPSVDSCLMFEENCLGPKTKAHIQNIGYNYMAVIYLLNRE